MKLAGSRVTKIVLLVIGIVALGLAVFFISRGVGGAKTAGTITIIIVNDEEIVNEKVKYQKNDTLLDILEDSYQAKVKDSTYGAYLTGLANVNLTSEMESEGHYIAFYINDEYATKGVSQTELEDGNVYKFVFERFLVS